MNTQQSVEVRALTSNGSRCRILCKPNFQPIYAGQSHVYVRYSNGCEQTAPLLSLRITDRRSRARSTLFTEQDAIRMLESMREEQACEAFLASTPSAWQSVPATFYNEQGEPA